MRRITERSIWTKILIAFLTFLLLFQFMMPPKVYAFGWDTIVENIEEGITNALSKVGKTLLLGVARIVAQIGDLVEGAMNNFMLGVNGFGSAMISHEALEKNTGAWFIAEDSKKTAYEGLSGEGDVDVQSHKKDTVIVVKDGTIEEEPNFFGSGTWEIPNILYSPENIFGNNIAMLDVNFLRPNEYQPVISGSTAAEEKQTSIGTSLHNTITSWYLAFRNIAIVALLSILVYLGIRIIIGSTAEDKAKYKQTLKDWAIALCLIFVMHFIMSAVIMIINRVNTLFQEINNSVYLKYGGEVFKTNFTGAMRFLAQSKATENAWVYTLIYMVLIFYTITFTIQYLKRVLYIAFYTMISPLVAITYPMDKLGDGKSQAFNKWFKEYLMTMALQPIHLVLYTVLVSSALTLSIKQPLFALVAIGFLVEAEKFIKSLFGIQSQADGGFGSFASGALAMKAIDSFSRGGKGGNGGKNSGNNQQNQDEVEDRNTVRQAKNKPLESFRGDSDANNESRQELNRQPSYNELSNESENNDTADFRNIDTGWGGNQQTSEEQEFDDAVRNVYLPENEETQNGYELDEISADIDENGTIRFNNQEQAVDNQTAEMDENAENSEDSEAPENNNSNIPNQNANTPSSQEMFDRIRKNRRNAYLKSLGKAAIGKTIKGVKKVGRTTLKATGAGVFGTIGLAAGLAGGNGFEGTVKMAAGGAYAGSAIGNRAANTVGSVAGGVKAVAQEEMRERREYRDNLISDYRNAGMNDKADELEKQKAMKSNKYNKMIQEYAVKKGKKFKKDEIKDLRSRIYDYDVKRGITDKDKIFKGLDLEEKYNPAGTQQHKYTHEQIADAMQLTNMYGREFATKKDKIEQFDSELEAYGVRDKQKKDDVKRLFYEVHGGDNYDEFVSRLQSPQQSNNTTRGNTTRNSTTGRNTTRNNTTRRNTAGNTNSGNQATPGNTTNNGQQS